MRQAWLVWNHRYRGPWGRDGLCHFVSWSAAATGLLLYLLPLSSSGPEGSAGMLASLPILPAGILVLATMLHIDILAAMGMALVARMRRQPLSPAQQVIWQGFLVGVATMGLVLLLHALLQLPGPLPTLAGYLLAIPISVTYIFLCSSLSGKPGQGVVRSAMSASEQQALKVKAVLEEVIPTCVSPASSRRRL